MPLYTKSYALPYPVPTDKADVPRDIKALAEKMDAMMHQLFPVGTILPYVGSTIPEGWHACDGTAHGSPELQYMLGSANTPNLVGKFLVGTGYGYVYGDTGGVASVTLTAAQAGIGAHSHTLTVTVNPSPHTHDWGGLAVLSGWINQDHAHVFDPPATGMGGGGHEHGVIVREGYDPSTGNEGGQVDTHPSPQDPPKQVGYTNGGGGHEHTLDIGGFWTSGINANHDHYVDIPQLVSTTPSYNLQVDANISASTGVAASSSHENRPPYMAYKYMIKTGLLTP
jgi:microcystin-dependent protein